jgi:hypothetical protein
MQFSAGEIACSKKTPANAGVFKKNIVPKR